MLYIFGVKPIFNECVICGGKEIVNFSIKEGGTLCTNCATQNTEALKVCEWFYKLYSDKEYDETKYEDIDYKDLLNQIYSYYLIHVNLKLKDYLLFK